MLWGCLLSAVIGWLWDERDARWWRCVLPFVGDAIGGGVGGSVAGYIARRPPRKA